MIVKLQTLHRFVSSSNDHPLTCMPPWMTYQSAPLVMPPGKPPH